MSLGVLAVQRKGEQSVGYWLPDRKLAKVNFNRFEELCRERHIRVVSLNLKADLESQGPFNVILHQASDLIAKTKEGDDTAAALITKFKNYLHLHPETIVLDPLGGVQKLANRYRTYKLIRSKLSNGDVQVIQLFSVCNFKKKQFCTFLGASFHANSEGGRLSEVAFAFPQGWTVLPSAGEARTSTQT